jgi:hypothetical protein
MKTPSNKELLFQLRNLELWCEGYLARHPRNHGEYARLTDFYKPLRDGIVFYSSGWGWRLRKDWREAITRKRAELQAGEGEE